MNRVDADLVSVACFAVTKRPSGPPPELRSSAIRLAKSMNYRNMSWKHRKRIAVLINSFSNFNTNLLKEIRNEARNSGYDIAIIPIENISQLNDQVYDGAFIISCSSDQVFWSEKFRIPLVVINHYGNPMENISNILPDADQEIRAAMEHFIALGHRKIARIRFRGKFSTEREQQRGIKELYRIAEDYQMQNSIANLCADDFQDEIAKVLELADQGYTAFLVVMSDWIPQLLKSIRETGRDVPRDISLIAYECSLSAWQTPPVTTLQFDYPLIARTAFEQLFKRKKNRKDFQIAIPCKLILRASTAPLSSGANADPEPKRKAGKNIIR